MGNLSESEKLKSWLKKKSQYADNLFKTEQSNNYMSYFNDDYTPQKGIMSPYKDNDVDITNTSMIRYNETNFSSNTSDFYKDLEVVFIKGSNHCNVNYLYKRIIESMSSYGKSIPILTKDSDGHVIYSKKKLSTRVNKEKFYKMIMNIST